MIKLTEKQTSIIKTLGYDSALSFVTHYPFRYENLESKPYNQWNSGDLIAFEARLVSNLNTYRFGGKQSRTSFKVAYDEEIINVTLYNQPFLRAAHYQERIIVIGTVDDKKQIIGRSISNKPLSTFLGIKPIYGTRAKIKQFEIQRLMAKILNQLPLENIIPNSFKDSYRLMNRKQALLACHFPTSFNHLHASLRTLKYEEFLLYHLKGGLNAMNLQQGVAKWWDKTTIRDSISNLPYTLTQDQENSLNEIMNDIQSPRIMNRLLQGDVGSGKTVVSLLGAFGVIGAGYQVAFMVPTEILLAQHYQTAKALFPSLNIAMLSQSTQDRQSVLEGLKSGDIQLIIGTHALYQEDVQFKNLGLAIIDEQHRFGVHQRRALINKGASVDVLMLSATPIPRTLASSLYFDLDISSIQTYPAHRKVNETILVEENSIRSILDDLKARLESDDQIYVVCPAIEAGERKGIRNVISIYEQFKALFKEYEVGILHGKMSAEEKELVMNSFANGTIHILISTTVIEVGIDVHTANTMVVYNAELFGLSTLHQLRGRIGRGKKGGVCYLLSSHSTEESFNRLQALKASSDGFELSMMDLRQRGMGDILGDRQSGLPNFLLGDIEKDQAILAQAKIDAKTILENSEDTDFKDIVNIAKHDKIMYN